MKSFRQNGMSKFLQGPKTPQRVKWFDEKLHIVIEP